MMAAEAAGVHSDWLDEFPDDYPPRIRELIQEGRSLTARRIPASQGSNGSAQEVDLRCAAS